MGIIGRATGREVIPGTGIRVTVDQALMGPGVTITDTDTDTATDTGTGTAAAGRRVPLPSHRSNTSCCFPWTACTSPICSGT